MQGSRGLKMSKPLKESVYDFIISYVSSNGFPPTQIEIADALGHSTRSAVQLALSNLEKKIRSQRSKD